MNTELSQRMVAAAEADRLPAGHELRLAAAAFEEATTGFLAPKQTHTVAEMFKAWTRARRAWAAYQGVPVLVEA